MFDGVLRKLGDDTVSSVWMGRVLFYALSTYRFDGALRLRRGSSIGGNGNVVRNAYHHPHARTAMRIYHADRSCNRLFSHMFSSTAAQPFSRRAESLTVVSPEWQTAFKTSKISVERNLHTFPAQLSTELDALI